MDVAEIMIEHQKKVAKELAVITQVLTHFPWGAGIEDIIKATHNLGLERRTLQRRLASLIDSGAIEMRGAKRSAKYHLNSQNFETNVAAEPIVPAAGTTIPLSPASQEILKVLSVPFTKRKAVTYHRKFVDHYRPNIDFYLSAEERAQLARLTSSPVGMQQPAGTYAKHILHRLLIDLSWNSSRLEGNTYSLLDTERLLSQGLPAAGKSAEEAQMILNHKEAIEFIVAGGDEIGFNRYTLLNLHAILANNLLPDPAAPGRLRSFAVGIKRSSYTPTAIPQLINEMFNVILAKTAAIKNPHEQALFAMVQLPYLQPFEDVNKRVSRLAANIPLSQHNLIPISFIGVPEDLYILGLLAVYELNRTELLKDIFLWACARSADRYAQVRQTIGEPDPFRLKYKTQLQSLITEIVSHGITAHKASAMIRANASHLPHHDQDRFIEMVETELLSLHEGNFARYRVRPTEFARWKEIWGR